MTKVGYIGYRPKTLDIFFLLSKFDIKGTLGVGGGGQIAARSGSGRARHSTSIRLRAAADAMIFLRQERRREQLTDKREIELYGVWGQLVR